MPTYEYRCDCGKRFERVLKVADYKEPQTCACGRVAEKLISIPSVYVQPDICYDSPVDGRPITNKQARDEDLARAGCVPWEIGIRQDHQAREKREEKQLHDEIRAAVEEQVTAASGDERAKLGQQLGI